MSANPGELRIAEICPRARGSRDRSCEITPYLECALSLQSKGGLPLRNSATPALQPSRQQHNGHIGWHGVLVYDEPLTSESP